MNRLEKLENMASLKGIDIQKTVLPDKISGIYYHDRDSTLIALNSTLETQAEQACTLAEELGHLNTSCGDLLTDPNVPTVTIRQQEERAKRWAYKILVSIKKLIQAYEAGVRTRQELVNYLEITDDFLEKSISFYKEKYGIYMKHGNYFIYLDPFGIMKVL